MSKKVAIGMSGGVDSCAAACILREKGYDVFGITLLLRDGDSALGDIEDAKRAAQKLGIKHLVADFRQLFKEKIISDFANEYLNARTPNPCVKCNRDIKFGAMLDFALQNGADFLATGHYAKIDFDGERYLLKKGAGRKDQSYFLCRLNQFQLAHAMFPLAETEKEAARQLVAAAGIEAAQRPDSQEICFVPDDDYSAFLATLGIHGKEGNIIDKNGQIIGRHTGIINYTIGQRKGLGAFGKPMFVTRLNAADNTVTIGENGEQYSAGLVADSLNLISCDTLGEAIRADVKIRFRAPAVPATVTPSDDGKIRIVFDEPQRSVTPGQAAVLYDGDTVIGGGRIIAALD